RFVSLHPDSLGSALLSLPELAARITKKRVQYQANVGREVGDTQI
ncbi:hypothetical protein GVX82_00435, partial [Patescibacteria group bacterium]|nr:hypothetical protein [Patescibacteria group bacterium]